MPREPLFRRYRRFHRPDPARDVDEELAFHLAMRVDELMRGGMTEPEARRAAMERFGSFDEIREECEELGRERVANTRRADRWGALAQDVRYGLRAMASNRGFALAVALTMAIGIGANSAVFSVAYGVLLRPLPYRDQDQLVRLWSNNLARGLEFFSVSPADFAVWREERAVFSAAAAFERQREATLVRTGNPESVEIAAVTPDIFPLLGTAAAHGRTLAPADAQPGAPAVVVLRHDLWSARFGADPAVIGQDVRIDGRRFTVAGVMPPRFSIPGTPAQLWTPLDLTAAPTDHGNRYLRVLVRLAPGITIDDARARLELVSRRLGAEFPATNGSWGVSSMPVTEMVIGRQFKRAVQILVGVVALVLLIACSNAANLQLARGAARRREIAIRSALGAGRGRIVRQMLTESVLLGVMAGVTGLFLAYGGVVLLRAIGERTVPRLEDVRLDAPVLLFTTAVTLLGGLLFGLLPALRASRADTAEVLKEGGRSGSGAIGNRTRSALIISEVALSLVLLIGAGLLMRSFARLQSVDLGFAPAGVSIAQMRLPEDTYSTPERLAAFWSTALDRARAEPGVEMAALVSSAPFAGPNSGLAFVRTDRPVDPQTQAPDADYRVTSAGYLQTMGIRLTRGRDFSELDHAGAPSVILVSETLAREGWPGEDPLGKGIRVGDILEGPEFTVIGVVDDVRYLSLESQMRPMMYFSAAARPQRTMAIAFRGNSPALPPRVRDAVATIDPSLPAPTVTAMDALVHDALATPRFALVLFAVFAAVALGLAAIGIYGVMSYLVRQRTQEMGIRIALGAPARSIVGAVVGRALALTVIGVATGLLGAWWLTRFASTLLFGVSTTDPLTYAMFAAVLCAVAALGSLVPAWRATRADPLEALRGVEKRPG